MTAEQIHQYMQTPEKLNQETLPLFRELTEQHPAFEAGWILYLKNLKNLNDSAFEQELINGAIRIHDRRKLYLFLNAKTEKTENDQAAPTEADAGDDTDIYNLIFPSSYRLETPEKEEKEEEETMGDIARSMQKTSENKFSLIEKFLEAQPKMTPVKEDESASPMDSQNQKEEVSDELVTETLAFIYARQGYNKKAIHIFEKLSLKYPEKSTYFAGQIEKIKNLMNN